MVETQCFMVQSHFLMIRANVFLNHNTGIIYFLPCFFGEHLHYVYANGHGKKKTAVRVVHNDLRIELGRVWRVTSQRDAWQDQRSIVFSWFITPITMVYDTQITMVKRCLAGPKPRCEPWCWNMNTYIYPKIAQFCG